MIFIVIIFQVSLSQIRMQLTDECSCESLINQEECQLVQWCEWTSKCEIKKPTVVADQKMEGFHSLYCESLQQPECQTLEQCAFIRGSCQAFAGCVAYGNQSFEKCHMISKLCTWDGTSRVCIYRLPCSQYGDKNCESSHPTNGESISCKKHLGKCIQLECTDAPITYTTDKQCNNYIQGCVTNGQGCTHQLLECKNYTINSNQDCNKMVGIDGFCATFTIVTYPQRCLRIPCIGVINPITPSDVLKYQITATNQTCNLDQCEQISGNYETLIEYTDKDGNPCWLDNVIYRKKKCSDIKKPINNSQCYIQNQNCVFDGVECQDELKPCQFYNTNCKKRISKDGYCMDTSDGCRALKCLLVPSNMDCTPQHEQCKFVSLCGLQINCNGLTPDQCHTNCRYQNYQCNEVNNYCQEQTTRKDCQNLNCKWTDYCGTTQSCSYAKSELECKLTTSLNGFNCIWEQIFCVEPKQCEQARSRVALVDQCTLFGEHCIANGNACTLRKHGCIDYGQVVCDKSTSMRGQCQWLDNKCKEIECNSLNTQCDRITNCYYDGIKCSSGPLHCSDYKLQKVCQVDTSGRACLWNNAAKPECQPQTICAEINIKGPTFKDCQQYSPDCVSNGYQCMPIQFCDQYEPTSTLCIKGIDGQCGIMVEKNGIKSCRNTSDKSCSDSGGNTHQLCQLWMPQCTTNGTSCSDLLNQCKFYGNEQSCTITTSFRNCKYDTTCRPLECEDLGITNCYSKKLYSNNNTALQETCITINNEQEVRCLSMRINCSMYTKQAECVTTLTNKICIWKTTSLGIGLCQELTKCEDITNEKTCNSISGKCFWQSISNTCIDLTCQDNYQFFKICQNLQLFGGQTVKCEFNEKDGGCQSSQMTNADCLNISQLTKHLFKNSCIPCQTEAQQCKYNQRPLSSQARNVIQVQKNNQLMQTFAQIVLILLVLII